jgi:hypothetical protein
MWIQMHSRIMDRRRFLVGAIGLPLTQGCQSGSSDQGQSLDESLKDQFQSDFHAYGYDSYLSICHEWIGAGLIRSEMNNERKICEEGLTKFCHSHDILERYAANEESLRIRPNEFRVDDKKIARMSFQLDCGFPVVALVGVGGQRVQCCY